MNRERFRPIETSACASQCGIVLPRGLNIRMDYSWAFAEEKAKRGDTSRLARMLPNMTEAEAAEARQAAGPATRKALEVVHETMAAGSASSSSRNPNVKASPRPSSAPEPKAAKKSRRQGG